MTSAKDTRCFELRTYSAATGKLDDLHNRFRNHTLRLFEKHGIENIGYWVPMDKDGKPENKLIFLLAYPSRDAREKSWSAFQSDPEWQAASKASEAKGRLVTNVQNPYLEALVFTHIISSAELLQSLRGDDSSLAKVSASLGGHRIFGLSTLPVAQSRSRGFVGYNRRVAVQSVLPK